MAGVAILWSGGDGVQCCVPDDASIVRSWPRRHLSRDASVAQAVVSRNGQMVASAFVSGQVDVQLLSAQLLQRLAPSTPAERRAAAVHSVCFSSDSRLLCAAGEDKIVKIWDLKKQAVVTAFTGHQGSVNRVCFSLDDSYVASAGSDGSIRVHNVLQSQTVGVICDGEPHEITDMRFSPLRKFELATASVDGSIRVFDAKVKKALVSFTSAHQSPATGVVFSPTNRVFLSSCGLDKRILFFDSAASKRIETVIEADVPLSCIDFSPDGRGIAVGDLAGCVHYFDLRSTTSPLYTIDSRSEKPLKSVYLFETSGLPAVCTSEADQRNDFRQSSIGNFESPSETSNKRGSLTPLSHNEMDMFSPMRDTLPPEGSVQSRQKSIRETTVSSELDISTSSLNLSQSSELFSPVRHDFSHPVPATTDVPGKGSDTPNPSSALGFFGNISPIRTSNFLSNDRVDLSSPLSTISPSTNTNDISFSHSVAQNSTFNAVSEHVKIPGDEGDISSDADPSLALRFEPESCDSSTLYEASTKTEKVQTDSSLAAPIPEPCPIPSPSVLPLKVGALQADVIRSVLDDALDGVRSDVRNLHVDMIRQLHQQKVEMAHVFEERIAHTNALLEALKVENEQLRDQLKNWVERRS